MIHFFRRIRHKLLTENRLTRYLIYAIGEIALVMIGILLALQVNNWNEQRKQNKLEHTYLIALKEEFKENLVETERVIALNARIMKKAQEMAKHTGPDKPTISDKELGKIFFGFIGSEVQYRPGTGVVNEIISSGKLNIFRDPELKKSLASLDGLLLKVRFQEKDELGFVRMELTSFLQSANVSSRRMVFDAFGDGFEVDQGKFTQSNLHLLNSMQFDNLLTQFIYTAGFLNVRYEELKKEIEKIIHIIDIQLDI